MKDVKDRTNKLYELGLKFNGEWFIFKDIEVHHTELLCDTDEEFQIKVDKIKKHIKSYK